ncbi:hypothetical protein GUITHDRAFT_122187 [Guillardia theta CCMP2712]|uniref:Uncharacterized protein n=1 Tax=Guillardia theta (strain CCMP2712) TaxID=905079 RepID=L1I6A1_GUITC|nr:hypothetical protein GUITHDRAFT_122187 [Guillardia theta CCMP2712]EKX31627.1 hypothetical protein GUITHDRAFT_122187 [Guillardia theta CCMP2712]|eukprot:XP_005818607.1 hypothetical protein GUITHDRAFT_122187 [Guillardia theta CCMP2712]
MLLWWNEAMPGPYLRLREAVGKQPQYAPYIKVEQYLGMLKEAKVNEKEAKVVTSFLHDMGALKFCGHELRVADSKEKRFRMDD